MLDDKQMKSLIKRLYDTASKFDLAYIHAITNNGKSSFTGEEYDELNDVLIEAEEFLGIE